MHVRSKLKRGHDQRGSSGKVTLAPKPIFHGVAQLIERDVRANFQDSIGHGKRIVKHSRVGEIAHAEAVEPLQRTRLKLATELVFNADLAGKHSIILITEA